MPNWITLRNEGNNTLIVELNGKEIIREFFASGESEVNYSCNLDAIADLKSMIATTPKEDKTREPILAEDLRLMVDPSVPAEMILFPDEKTRLWFKEIINQNLLLDDECTKRQLKIFELQKPVAAKEDPHDLVCNSRHEEPTGSSGCSCISRREREAAKEETPPDVQKIIRIIDWVMVTEEKMQAQADGDYVDDNEIDDNNNALSNLRKQLPAIRAALVSQSKDGWQDINTAPKDGTKILLLCPYKTENSGMRIGHEQPKIVIGRWVIPDLTDKKYHCINVHKKKLMQRHGGFWSAHFKGVQALAGQPTYWQSLPAAPVEGE